MKNENIEKIAALFPNCITESIDENGKLKKAINFDMLRAMLSDDIAEDEERYDFTWVGKKKAAEAAGTPIRKTLRPCIEESKDWENTGNLYIEGDNLDALKLLQESYLGKVKMIYIDPPYNTGHDFIYKDDFKMSAEEYNEELGVRNEEGDIMFRNTDTNGRFHSDWCSMMYPRLKLARNLLSDDGVIFISIDDNEQSNLKKICDEVFGAQNFIVEFVWKCRNSLQHDEPLVSKQTERIILYTKNRSLWNSRGVLSFNRVRKPFDATEYKNPDNDPRGPWLSSGKTRNDGRRSYTVISPTGKKFTKPWIPSPEEFKRWEKEGLIWWGKDGNSIPRKKAFLKDFKGNAISDILLDEYTDEIIGENSLKRIKRWEIGTTESGTKGEKLLFDNKVPFAYPKPWTLIKYFVQIATNENDIILDFFSGSATTAHAVMQLNAEDGGNRKFIMVQLPEECDEKSEAYKAGYKNVCEIGKERIRRAGEKIKAEIEESNRQLKIDEELKAVPDIGFRVLKIDSTNMKDVYYGAAETDQLTLDDLVSKIKEDRTDLDLLYGVLTDLGLPLGEKHEVMDIDGVRVHNYDDLSLVACFEENVPESVIKKIASLRSELTGMEPMRAVFRDSSFPDDPSRINVEEIFKLKAPATEVKVI